MRGPPEQQQQQPEEPRRNEIILVDEAVTLNRAVEILQFIVHDLRQKLVQIEGKLELHDNQIEVYQDQWSTIASLGNNQNITKRYLQLHEEGLVEQKRLIVENKYAIQKEIDKLKEAVAVLIEKEHDRVTMNNDMYKNILFVLITILIMMMWKLIN